MSVTIQLPAEIEQQLREQDPKLDESARAQFLIANYKAGNLSTGDLAMILGVGTRHEVDAWLAERGIDRPYSLDDLEADRAALDKLLGPARR
jgi:hypothetical protein